MRCLKIIFNWIWTKLGWLTEDIFLHQISIFGITPILSLRSKYFLAKFFWAFTKGHGVLSYGHKNLNNPNHRLTCKNCSYLSAQTIKLIHNTVTYKQFYLIFPFLHTNVTSQMWPSGSKGSEANCAIILLQQPSPSFLSTSLYFSKRGAYWDRLWHDVVGWLSRACTVAKRCILGL